MKIDFMVFSLIICIIYSVFCRTVWYELICFELPFKNQPAESVVWQVGKGLKQSLSYIQTSSDVKVCRQISYFNLKG